MRTTPPRAAAAAGLHYALDDRPGVTRARAGKGFGYRDDAADASQGPAGARAHPRARDPARLDERLDLPHRERPPAGDRPRRTGRKQYRYHPRWREVRDETKYQRHDRVRAALPRAPRARRVATSRGPACRARRCSRPSCGCWRATLIRVGNEEYARTNRRSASPRCANTHVDVSRGRVALPLPRQERRATTSIDLRDPRLGRIVKRCQELPGQRALPVRRRRRPAPRRRSADVNAYLREVAGARLHRQGLPHLGGHGPRGAGPARVRALGRRRPPVKRNVVAGHRGRREPLGNTPRSAASATSTPRSSSPTWTARCRPRSPDRSPRDRAAPACAPTRRACCSSWRVGLPRAAWPPPPDGVTRFSP